MQSFWNIIIEQLKKQGLSVLLLFAGIWFLYTDRQSANERIELCHKDQIEYYKNNTNMLIEAMNRNTEALKELQKERE
jgi:hypothetical protein